MTVKSTDNWELAKEFSVWHESLEIDSSSGDCEESVEFTRKSLAIFLSEIAATTSDKAAQVDLEFTTRMAFMLACMVDKPIEHREEAHRLLNEYNTLRKEALGDPFTEDSAFRARVMPGVEIMSSHPGIPQSILRPKFSPEK